MKKAAEELIKEIQGQENMEEFKKTDECIDLLSNYMADVSQEGYKVEYSIEFINEADEIWRHICKEIEEEEIKTAMNRFLFMEQAYYNVAAEVDEAHEELEK